MSEDQIKTFNALCDVVIYHFCDVCHKAGAEDSESVALLCEQGIMMDDGDAYAAYAAYEERVREYAAEHLPASWTFQHDYWGAACFSEDKSQRAPKHGMLFAGDSAGKIMLFENWEAMQAYTQDSLENLV